MGQSGIDVEIMKILTEYTAEVGNKINKAGDKLAKQAMKWVNIPKNCTSCCLSLAETIRANALAR